MSNSLSQRNVAAQWDVGKTAFTSADRLLQLISTVTQDNVQPQAVLAAEALGLSLMVSSKRIDEAIVALGGNESTRLADFKVMIGLSSGGVVRIIRNSTALTQIFLVATACKLCYVTSEIGNLLFEMIATSGILTKFAVSSSQLAQLVYAFSGHAEGIVPVDLMHEVAIAVSTISGHHSIYQPLETKILAELLFKVFDGLRDDSVESITLSGAASGVWLTTFFIWLLPEITSIFVQQQLIRGSGNSKLCIQLDPVIDCAWKMQTWKAEGQPTSFVFSELAEDKPKFDFLPIRLTKNYLENHSRFGNTKERSMAISIAGALAGGIICLLMEEGNLFTWKLCCRNKTKCAATPLRSAMSGDWISRYENVLLDYGWDESIKDGQGQAYAKLRSGFRKNRQRSSDDAVDTIETIGDLITRLSTEYIDERSGEWPLKHLNSFVFDFAFRIAADAVATAVCNFVSGHRRMSLKQNTNLERRFLSAPLTMEGLNVYAYQRHAFSRLFPANYLEEDDLIVALDGLVAGWEVLWKISAQQSDVLSIRICVGHIRRQDIVYESIRESPSHPTSTSYHTPVEQLNLLSEGQYQGLTPRRESDSVRHHPVISVSANRLHLKSYLVWRSISDGTENSRRVSWMSSIVNLTTAWHVDRGHDLNALQSSDLSNAYMTKT